MFITDSSAHVSCLSSVILGPEEKERGCRRHKTRCEFYAEGIIKECQKWNGYCGGIKYCHEYEDNNFISQKYYPEAQVYEALREWQQERYNYLGF